MSWFSCLAIWGPVLPPAVVMRRGFPLGPKNTIWRPPQCQRLLFMEPRKWMGISVQTFQHAPAATHKRDWFAANFHLFSKSIYLTKAWLITIMAWLRGEEKKNDHFRTRFFYIYTYFWALKVLCFFWIKIIPLVARLLWVCGYFWVAGACTSYCCLKWEKTPTTHSSEEDSSSWEIPTRHKTMYCKGPRSAWGPSQRASPAF